MAFIKIKKAGGLEITVTEKSFHNFYKQNGYVEVKEESEQDVEETKEVEEEEAEEDIDTTPISEMTKEQLLRFAEKHNIDTKSARNVREARKVIQEAVKNKKM